jgi:hypothetical protein
MLEMNLRLCLAQGEKRLLETDSVSDVLLKFFQTKILFNQLLTSKLRE